MNLLKAFALAWNMLTILPFFKVHHFFKGINGYSAMLYPLVGFVLGLILFFVATLLEDFVPAMHLGVIIFVLWVVMSGALHVDGLSDSIDGLFVSKVRSLEVMKDADVGGMGMIFTSLFLLLKLSSVLFFHAYYLLPIILMLSRLNATLAIYFYNYISSGVGELLKEELRFHYVLFALFYSLLLSYFFSFLGAFLLSLSLLIVIAQFFRERLGGLNGDVYGFIIEMSELALLNYIIVAL